MEDALVHYKGGIVSIYDVTGLNPCFNGRCTRTNKKNALENIFKTS